jgi:hypothetical protein
MISFYFFEDIYILQTRQIDKDNFNKYGGIKFGALGAFFRIIFVKVKRLESQIHGSKKIKGSIIWLLSL